MLPLHSPSSFLEFVAKEAEMKGARAWRTRSALVSQPAAFPSASICLTCSRSLPSIHTKISTNYLCYFRESKRGRRWYSAERQAIIPSCKAAFTYEVHAFRHRLRNNSSNNYEPSNLAPQEILHGPRIKYPFFKATETSSCFWYRSPLV